MKNKKVLVFDPSKKGMAWLSEKLQNDYLLKVANSYEEVISELETKKYSVFLFDLSYLNLKGEVLLDTIRDKKIPTVVILTAGIASLDSTVKAFQHGAFDVISEPYDLTEMKGVIDRAVQHSDLLSQSLIKMAIQSSPKIVPKVLVGRSSKMINVYKQVARASQSSSHCLIIGESGTGKELVARAIHENSQRKSKNFVAINCGAISETLLESELFGYVRGAFTGAHTDRKGLFEVASEGTLFLDEIGDITPALQVKLLRALQENEIRPVGSSVSKKVNVRIIAATHRDLDKLILQDQFRKDLYYRINVLRIDMPALCERVSDIPELIRHFLIRLSDRSGTPLYDISEEAIQFLKSYPWHGNVRELENVIERAANMARSSRIHLEDLPEEVLTFKTKSFVEPKEDLEVKTLEQLEKEHILRSLKLFKNNKTKVAHALGIDRVTLYRKAQRYGLKFD